MESRPKPEPYEPRLVLKVVARRHVGTCPNVYSAGESGVCPVRLSQGRDWPASHPIGGREMIDVEIRAAEGGEDAKLLIDILAACYKRRAVTYG